MASDIEYIGLNSELRKKLIHELIKMATVMSIDSFDVISDLIALIEVKNNAHFELFVIYLYLILTVFITLTYCYVAFHYTRDAYIICKQLRYGIPNILNDKQEHSHTGNAAFQNNDKFSANIEADYMSISRGIGQERVSSLLILIQDIPMIIFNCILILSCNFRDNLMILSLMLNMVNFGYNLSSKEKIVSLRQHKKRLDSFLQTIKYIRKKARTMDPCTPSTKMSSRNPTLKMQKTFTNIEKIIRQISLSGDSDKTFSSRSNTKTEININVQNED